ncbi:MAG: hypothetical protein AAB372_02170 [Patescibacteria group bacterium]
MNQDIHKILEAAITAPSGENAQPWRFRVHETQIELFNDPASDTSFFNYGQRGSYVAHGAAIENMVLQAGVLGYAIDVKLFPTKENPDLVAILTLEKKGEVATDPLASVISHRCTNRKPYKKEPLTATEKEAVVSAGRDFKEISLTLVDDKNSIETIARIGGLNEQIMLSTPEIHDFFFSHVNWTKEEDDAKKTGFYIETLELPPPAKAMFKLFKHWSVMRVFSALGFPKVVAKQNAAVYASAGAVIGAVIPDSSPESYIAMGRSVERMWLMATKLGLSIQPLGGVMFLMSKIRSDKTANFSESHATLIKQAHKESAQIFNAGEKIVGMSFRIGRGDPPSARAIRFPVEDVLI